MFDLHTDLGLLDTAKRRAALEAAEPDVIDRKLRGDEPSFYETQTCADIVSFLEAASLWVLVMGTLGVCTVALTTAMVPHY